MHKHLPGESIEQKIEERIEEDKFIKFLGKNVVGLADHLGKLIMLFLQIIFWTFRRPFDFKNIYKQMNEVGVNSLVVASLTSVSVGMVMALQTGAASKNILNEPLYVGTAVGFSIVKELGPVLTSIVIAGRVGAAFTAELGTMRVTEQIDALYTLGANPVKYLIVPRFLACVVMVPILTIYSNILGILGGLFVSVYKLAIPSTRYYHDIVDFMRTKDIVHGLVKCVVFGIIIALISCYKGFTTEGGAEGVGKSTTQSVVISMVLILVTDTFLTNVLQFFGIG
jgi:phospholipid/cholesterol/gamma-HCH transport system permease protein